MMFSEKNPFVLTGYISENYFCDRKDESRRLISEITIQVYDRFFSLWLKKNIKPARLCKS